ncbi:hypothetical protein A2U01_0006687, partial [Trifolium medium]|nr:hypothetical protein [Trifolium medium]
TTYFFTDFPDSYRAKALFNTFHLYGDIMEVVIPAKRDKGGRRFGFARFDNVEEPRKLESELDNIIIGRVKISVNLSRFQRREEHKRSNDMDVERKGIGGNQNLKHNRQQQSSKYVGHHFNHDRQNVKNTYAHVVRTGEVLNQGGRQQHIALSYEAVKDDFLRLQKAFIGVVAHPGMSYNIQNAFHSQGYFGVKVTPLGSNLTLLEGQEDGEVQALMEDAKDWLDQWFKEIRPWTPKDVDVERLVWLRIYGIPAHAWNDVFFSQVTRPWGNFLNADDATSKKLTMDVARLLIRTSCQKPVDEFLYVNVNGETFHLRIIEDSNGPMRLMLPQPQGQDGRDNIRDSSDDEEEEEVRTLLAAEEDKERESEGEGDNLLALNSVVIANNSPINVLDQVEDLNLEKERRGEFSNNSIYVDPNLNAATCDSVRGCADLEGGVEEEDKLNVMDGNLLGQEEGVVGPTVPIILHQNVIGGVNRRLSNSEPLGRSHKPNSLCFKDSGGKGERNRGVYSDGPRHVYNKLNSDPKPNKTPLKKKASQKKKGKAQQSVNLPSASLRKQHQLVQSLFSRNSTSRSSSSGVRPAQFNGAVMQQR